MARTDTPWEMGDDETYIKTIAPLGYNILINGLNKYLNFNNLVGSSGYGIRDNSGVMEFKNSGGAWGGLSGLTKSQADTYYYPLSTNPAVYLTSSTAPGAFYWDRNSTDGYLTPHTLSDYVQAGQGYIADPSSAEYVTNGDFTTNLFGWTYNPSIWQWASPGVARKVSTSANPFAQPVSLTVGNIYTISFDISNVVSGTTFSVTVGGSSVFSSTSIVAGHYSASFIAYSSANLSFSFSGSAKLDLDNVSIRDSVNTTAFISNGIFTLNSNVSYGYSVSMHSDFATNSLKIDGIADLATSYGITHLYSALTWMDNQAVIGGWNQTLNTTNQATFTIVHGGDIPATPDSNAAVEIRSGGNATNFWFNSPTPANGGSNSTFGMVMDGMFIGGALTLINPTQQYVLTNQPASGYPGQGIVVQPSGNSGVFNFGPGQGGNTIPDNGTFNIGTPVTINPYNLINSTYVFNSETLNVSGPYVFNLVLTNIVPGSITGYIDGGYIITLGDDSSGNIYDSNSNLIATIDYTLGQITLNSGYAIYYIQYSSTQSIPALSASMPESFGGYYQAYLASERDDAAGYFNNTYGGVSAKLGTHNFQGDNVFSAGTFLISSSSPNSWVKLATQSLDGMSSYAIWAYGTVLIDGKFFLPSISHGNGPPTLTGSGELYRDDLTGILYAI